MYNLKNKGRSITFISLITDGMLSESSTIHIQVNLPVPMVMWISQYTLTAFIGIDNQMHLIN